MVFEGKKGHAHAHMVHMHTHTHVRVCMKVARQFQSCHIMFRDTVHNSHCLRSLHQNKGMNNEILQGTSDEGDSNLIHCMCFLLSNIHFYFPSFDKPHWKAKVNMKSTISGFDCLLSKFS